MRTSAFKDEGEINLQTVVNKYMLKMEGETGICDYCGEYRSERKEIVSCPETLLIQINRAKEDGTKINCKIRSTGRKVELVVNGEIVTYETTGVIVHKGFVAEAGHYVYNYIDDNENWAQIDDHHIIRNDDVKADNKEGSIIVLKRAKSKENPWSSKTKECNLQTEKFDRMNDNHRWSQNKERNERAANTQIKEDERMNNNCYTNLNLGCYENIHAKNRQEPESRERYSVNQPDSQKKEGGQRKDKKQIMIDNECSTINDKMPVENYRNKQNNLLKDDCIRPSPKPICRWFLIGKCKFGHNCRNSHVLNDDGGNL